MCHLQKLHLLKFSMMWTFSNCTLHVGFLLYCWQRDRVFGKIPQWYWEFAKTAPRCAVLCGFFVNCTLQGPLTLKKNAQRTANVSPKGSFVYLLRIRVLPSLPGSSAHFISCLLPVEPWGFLTGKGVFFKEWMNRRIESATKVESAQTT
jgi:hypothetical protein